MNGNDSDDVMNGNDPEGGDILAALVSRRASAQQSLEAATSGYKKCRQRRGADAHKRGWYFQEQMQKWSGVVSRLDAEIAKLGDTPAR